MPDAEAASSHRPRWSLVVAILGSTMVFLDMTIVNVALPAIQRALGGTAAQMQWVVESYALLLASLVLVGGALGDRLGRRRVFSAGVVLFAVASAVCGAAPNATFLVLARGVQGVGGALLVPGSLALISAAYPENERGRAIGTWSATSGITSAIGPVVGGWVVVHASWRWLFYANVAVGAVVVALTLRHVRETRDETAPASVDWLGAVLAAAGLGAIVFALLDVPAAGGLGSPRVVALLAAGVAMLVAFVVAEARERHPMVPLSLFRSRTFAGTNLLTLLLYAALGGAIFFIPFNLIQVQRYSPTAAGAALLPLILFISALSPVAGALTARWGARGLLVVGPLVAGAGFALLARPGLGGSYWSTYFPGMLVLGLGMGATVAPLTTAVMASVEERHAGVASGVNNAVSRTAGLLAVAALGVVLTARFDSALGAELDAMAATPDLRAVAAAHRQELAGADFGAAANLTGDARAALRASFDAAYVAGFRTLMLVCAGLAALGALLAWAFVEGRAGVTVRRSGGRD